MDFHYLHTSREFTEENISFQMQTLQSGDFLMQWDFFSTPPMWLGFLFPTVGPIRAHLHSSPDFRH